jgi:hypothetical protein
MYAQMHICTCYIHLLMHRVRKARLLKQGGVGGQNPAVSPDYHEMHANAMLSDAFDSDSDSVWMCSS